MGWIVQLLTYNMLPNGLTECAGPDPTPETRNTHLKLGDTTRERHAKHAQYNSKNGTQFLKDSKTQPTFQQQPDVSHPLPQRHH